VDRLIPTERRHRLSLLAFLAIALLHLFIALPSQAQDAAELRVEPVTVETASGKEVFKAEIADTPELRQKGLMYRKEMAADAGMLFDFGAPRPVHMWMKNTYISLDMIFIRADGTVIAIGANTEPLSEAVVGVEEPVKGVLEVVAGTAARLGIKPGDRVYHAIFGNAPS
jgi:uncharacterized membrane protein (UPF0127 family)